MADFKPPSIRGVTPDEKIESLKRYLFSLAEQLNFSIDSVENKANKAANDIAKIANQPEYSENSAKGILWEDALTMNKHQMIFLFDGVSKQKNGICLVFSRAVDGVSTDDDFISFYLPKDLVKKHSGKGFSFPLNNATYAQVGAKYLFIHDDRIVGWHGNEEIGTNNGISYDNSQWVLRQVIGV